MFHCASPAGEMDTPSPVWYRQVTGTFSCVGAVIEGSGLHNTWICSEIVCYIEKAF